MLILTITNRRFLYDKYVALFLSVTLFPFLLKLSPTQTNPANKSINFPGKIPTKTISTPLHTHTLNRHTIDLTQPCHQRRHLGLVSSAKQGELGVLAPFYEPQGQAQPTPGPDGNLTSKHGFVPGHARLHLSLNWNRRSGQPAAAAAAGSARAERLSEGELAKLSAAA